MPIEKRKTGNGAIREKSDTDIAYQEMKSRAYEMRLSGMTYKQIGEVFDTAPMTIWRWIKKAIEIKQKPLTDEIRELELDRMDRYLLRLEDAIERGDIKSIGTALRISERRCALMGVDAPLKVEANVSVTEASVELQKVISEARSRIDAEKAAEGTVVSLELVAGTPGTYGPPGSAGASPGAGDGRSPEGVEGQLELPFGEIIDMPTDMPIDPLGSRSFDRSVLYPKGHPRR